MQLLSCFCVRKQNGSGFGREADELLEAARRARQLRARLQAFAHDEREHVAAVTIQSNFRRLRTSSSSKLMSVTNANTAAMRMRSKHEKRLEAQRHSLKSSTPRGIPNSGDNRKGSTRDEASRWHEGEHGVAPHHDRKSVHADHANRKTSANHNETPHVNFEHHGSQPHRHGNSHPAHHETLRVNFEQNALPSHRNRSSHAVKSNGSSHSLKSSGSSHSMKRKGLGSTHRESIHAHADLDQEELDDIESDHDGKYPEINAIAGQEMVAGARRGSLDTRNVSRLESMRNFRQYMARETTQKLC